MRQGSGKGFFANHRVLCKILLPFSHFLYACDLLFPQYLQDITPCKHQQLLLGTLSPDGESQVMRDS